MRAENALLQTSYSPKEIVGEEEEEEDEKEATKKSRRNEMNLVESVCPDVDSGLERGGAHELMFGDKEGREGRCEVGEAPASRSKASGGRRSLRKPGRDQVT